MEPFIARSDQHYNYSRPLILPLENSARTHTHRLPNAMGVKIIISNMPNSKKGKFLYNAVSSPWDCSKRFTLHPWQTCSFQHHFDLSGKHSATLQLLREDYWVKYPPLSVARYSFIQQSELWQRGINEFAKASKRQQEDSNPGSLD